MQKPEEEIWNHRNGNIEFRCQRIDKNFARARTFGVNVIGRHHTNSFHSPGHGNSVSVTQTETNRVKSLQKWRMHGHFVPIVNKVHSSI